MHEEQWLNPGKGTWALAGGAREGLQRLIESVSINAILSSYYHTNHLSSAEASQRLVPVKRLCAGSFWYLVLDG